MLISVDGPGENAAQPQLLDDGKHVVFTVVRSGSSEADSQIVVQAVEGRERRVLINGDADPHVLPMGQLVYIHNATVLVVPFDASKLSVNGDQAVPVANGVSQVGSSGQFAVSDEGRLVYQPGAFVSSTGSRALTWVNRHGDEEATQTPVGNYLDPRLSPDRTRLAVSSGGDILIWTFSTGTLNNLTFDAPMQYNPAWMPNSQHVVFDSSDGGQTQILRKAIDGTGPADVLSSAPAGYPESVAPHGELLTYHTPGNTLMLLPLAPGGPARPLVQTKAQTLNAEISPDGRWIAYQTNESGRFEIIVRPYPATDAGFWKVSSAGRTCPLWARTSDELFYLSGPPSQLTAVKVISGPGPEFKYGKSEALFSAAPYRSSVARSYDLSPDGSRFIMVKSVVGTMSRRPSLVYVSHWADEISGRQPPR
jgi:Tol biopolymer transport system component